MVLIVLGIIFNLSGYWCWFVCYVMFFLCLLVGDLVGLEVCVCLVVW